MNYLTEKKNDILIHLFFLAILSLYYLVPFFLVGQLILKPQDLLDTTIVENYIIGRIYNGDLESINLLLAGEIKWYYLTRIFQPLSIIYAFFETEIAYWLTDIIVKLICYFCFFKLSRNLNCSLFNSALIATIIVVGINSYYTALGLGMATLPYLIYLVIKNKNLNLKHYFIVALIGLNFALVYHLFVIPALFFASLILFPEDKKYNYQLFFKISLLLFLFAILSNSNLIYAQLFSGPFHRADFSLVAPDLLTNFNNLIINFFSIPKIVNNSYFFQELLFNLFSFFIILISLFSKNKKSYLILLIIFSVFFIIFILNLDFVVSLRNNIGGLLKTFNWQNIKNPLPVFYGLLFILNINFIVKKTKYLFYPIIILLIAISQITISSIPLGKHFLSFDDLHEEQKMELRRAFHDQNYKSLARYINVLSKNIKKSPDESFESKYTFKGYYDYENYNYIKSLIGDSRTISIGLDPMVAVMNNIKVIDGYHTIYPLSYKIKFRKIIEQQLNASEKTKRYFDLWGNRVYTFVENQKSIKTNFSEAKILGAEYVISKYSITSKLLLPICEICNDSNELFLYKITN